MSRVIFVMVITGLLHIADSLYYGTRTAAVRVRKVGIAFSLWGIIALFTRLFNTVQAPLTGSIVDQALLGQSHSVPASVLIPLAWKFRYIILASTIGSVIGALLVPTFIEIFTKILQAFEREGSVIKVFFRMARARAVVSFAESLRKPVLAKPGTLRGSSIPRGFLIANAILVGIYTTGVLSTIYSGALIPQYRLTADNLSGVINGIATLLLVIVVDPIISLITDQAVHGERNPDDVKIMVWYLVAGKIGGTILAQLFFLPASAIIASTALFIAKPAQVLAHPSVLLQFFSRLI